MIILTDVYKKFTGKSLLSNFSVKIDDGDLVCISGASGSGKTTLLNIIGLLEKPDSGEIIIDNLVNPNKREIQKLRREKIGYIFQNYGLVENESVQKNLNITSKFVKIKKKERESIYIQVLKEMGLSERYLHKKIYTLSGGEQQRVAISRLLITKPKYIFADEPTGNLDEKNRDIVFGALRKFNKLGSTVIYVSHDKYLINQALTNIDLNI